MEGFYRFELWDFISTLHTPKDRMLTGLVYGLQFHGLRFGVTASVRVGML